VELYTNLNTAAIPLATSSDSSFGQWEEVAIDLTQYREQLVYIAWHYVLFSFDSDPRFGWMLDDIAITATNIIPGTVVVTNNLWQARFVMSGPSGRSGQGASLVLTNAKPGNYQITFGDVPFFTTPAPQTNALSPSGTISFRGQYLMADTNNNGMADGWEQANFGSASSGRTRFTDTDADGFTDYAEFQAGTDPNQPTSTLRLNSPVKLVNGTVRLQWPAVPGRAYRVEARVNGGAWTPISDWALATSTSMSHTEAATVPGPTFFRVVVQP
jgi:hypothetical protein